MHCNSFLFLIRDRCDFLILDECQLNECDATDTGLAIENPCAGGSMPHRAGMNILD